MQDRLIRVVAEQAAVDAGDVQLTSSLAALGTDAYDLECLHEALEDEFEMTLPALANTQTVGELLGLVSLTG